uniref:Uncharacterized protein n=1 Tax=Tanacetum cinerariifolium TaxID=118510 RepID=A0A699HHF5_TANCI|nr:hypothetical protein [Tanacetum cinerariifolium]
MFPIELTNEDIKNSKAYKEYYVVASGAAPPKTKASVRKTKSSSDTTITPPTAAGTRLLTSAKGKQPAKSSKAKGTGIIPGFPSVPTDESDEEISWKSSDEDDDDEVDERKEAKDEESFDPIVQTSENSNDEGNDDASLGLNVGSEEGQDAEDDDDELYRDVNINLEGIDSLFETIPRVDVPSTTVSPLTLIAPTLSPPTIPTISQVPQAPTPPTTAPSTFLQDLPNFGSFFGFDHRLKTLEANFSKFVQTNQFARAVSSIPRIVERYMDQRVNEAVKIILDTYGDTVTLKRRPDDAGKDEEPSAGSDRGSKRRREGKEPESTSAPKEKETKTTGKSTQWSRFHQKTASESALAKEPMQTTQDLKEPSHQEFKTGAADDQPIAEASQHPECGAASHKYTTSVTKTKAADYGHIKWIEDLVPRTMWSQEPVSYDKEPARDVYSKHRIIAVTKHQIVEWHNYKHLDWIMLTNLMVEEHFAFNVSLRMFTRSIVIQRRVEDLQLVVKSYQKKLNLTKPDTNCSDLKRKEAYTAYSNPRGFIYQNKDKQNRLMRIDELHKFSDGTLNDVRTALDDRLKVIQMKYLPQAIWRKSDKERAAAMIQAIDK